MPNTELFAKIRDQIVAQPESFNMAVWDCGTARCVAGWAVHLSKADPKQSDHAFKMRYAEEHGLDDHSYQTVAGHLLGLSQETASNLFLFYEDDEALAAVKRYALPES